MAVDSETEPRPLRRRSPIVAARPEPLARLPVADGFVLDLGAHELRHDGRVVHLRPREYQLLTTLAANPGRAFTRGELMGPAWGRSEEGATRVVDVHIHWLRTKIEPRPGQPADLRDDPWLRLPTRSAPGVDAGVNRALTNGERSVDAAARR